MEGKKKARSIRYAPISSRLRSSCPPSPTDFSTQHSFNQKSKSTQHAKKMRIKLMRAETSPIHAHKVNIPTRTSGTDTASGAKREKTSQSKHCAAVKPKSGVPIMLARRSRILDDDPPYKPPTSAIGIKKHFNLRKTSDAVVASTNKGVDAGLPECLQNKVDTPDDFIIDMSILGDLDLMETDN